MSPGPELFVVCEEDNERIRSERRAYYAANPGARRREKLLNKYGITPADYDAMAEQQGGVCAICDLPPPADGVLCVDHDHDTGKVRGLLCRTCNTGIGHLRDDPALVRKAATYLESYA